MFKIYCIVLAFLIFLLSGLTSIHNNNFNIKKRLSYDYIDFKLLKENILNSFLNESSSVDSKYEKYFCFNNKNTNDIYVSIIPLSDRFNLNTMDFSVFDFSLFEKDFIDKDKFETFNRIISEKSFFTRKEFIDLMPETKFDNYFCTELFFNINFCDFEKLSRFVKLFLDNSKLSILNHNETSYISSIGELRLLLGFDFETLFPYINHNIKMNINFVDEKILELVLRNYYPKKYKSLIKDILHLRNKRALSFDDLKILFFDNKQLLRIFSCYTNIWKITMSNKIFNYESIIVLDTSSISDDQFIKNRKYFVIKESFYEK